MIFGATSVKKDISHYPPILLDDKYTATNSYICYNAKVRPHEQKSLL